MRTLSDNHLIEEAIKIEGNILRNVLICGSISKNGRKYSENVLRNLAEKYKGVAVYADHSEGAPTLEKRVGTVLEARYTNNQVRGDIELIANNPLTPMVLEVASKETPRIGLSHKITGKTHKGVVESVDQVLSVDVVSDPATTSTFFEQYNDEQDEFEALIERLDGLETQNKSLSEALETFRPLEEAVVSLNEQVKTLKEENESLKRKLKVKEICAPSTQILENKAIDISAIVKQIRS